MAQVIGGGEYLVALGLHPEVYLRPARMYDRDRDRDVLMPPPPRGRPLRVGWFDRHMDGDLEAVTLTPDEVAAIEQRVAALLAAEQAVR